eukprot:2410054-Amphidinium_carterae.1
MSRTDGNAVDAICVLTVLPSLLVEAVTIGMQPRSYNPMWHRATSWGWSEPIIAINAIDLS